MPSGRKEGNPGNKGGGRPSVKETQWHLDKWEQDSLVKQLKEKIANGVYSIRDMWLFKALTGSEPILKQAADKVLADLHDHTTKGETMNNNLVVYIPQKED